MTADDTTPETGVFDLSGPCAQCETPSADCDPHGIGAVCCAGCAATGGCTHQPAFDAADTVSAPSKPYQRDVIEAAAEIIARMSWEGPGQEWPQWDDATEEDREKIRALTGPIARALSDAHLLVARLRMAKANQRDAETEAATAVADLVTVEAVRDELREKVARVRALHILSPEEVHCWECGEEYPCPTIRALDGGES